MSVKWTKEHAKIIEDSLLTRKELAQRFGCDAGALNKAISNMKERGWIRKDLEAPRRASASDKPKRRDPVFKTRVVDYSQFRHVKVNEKTWVLRPITELEKAK